MYALRKTTPLALALALMLALLLGVLAMFGGKPASAQVADPGGAPSGSGIDPIFVPGNVNCPAGYEELRVNAPADGTFTDGTLTVTIDVRDTDQGQVFDWTSNIGVDIVVVKGGPDTNQFVYDSPGDPSTESKGDTGLHSPINPSNGKYYGLSHISFCYDVEPSIKVEKSGDELSKVGDKVTYTFTITNDGDIPLTLDEITDDKLGDLADEAPDACDTLAPGASCTFTVEHTIPAGASDPYVNKVTAVYSPDGFPNQLTREASHSVNLFQPSVTVEKTGPAEATVGQTITYTFTITNTSSNDSPDLIRDSINDTVLGDLVDEAPDACDRLAPGASCTFTANHTVQATDPNPLVNVVTATYHPEGFTNVIKDDDDHSVPIVTPAEGCTPGFWKNHPELWDGKGTNDITDFNTTDSFNATFGVTPAQSGLSNSVTLFQALSLGGGGKNALARHAVAALLSADTVDYPYTTDEVIALYQDAVNAVAGPETVNSALAKLVAANEAGCPLS